ncbi:MAG: HAD family hydrolase [Balneolaceae bacterium]|nr:MAG: HAD family hydrolase [Balneolaceae bacterium]
MRFKLVVFDIAGTTLQDNENDVSNAFCEAIELHGMTVEPVSVKRVMGYKKSEAIRMLLDEQGIEYTSETIDKIHDRFLDILNEHYKNADISEIEGVSNLFRDLKKLGIHIALNTGFSRSTTDIIISRMGWLRDSLIDDLIASDEVENGRPHSDMIKELARRFDISDNSVIVKVGDTPSDLLEGRAAGCGLVVGVLYGTHSEQELEKFDHDVLISSPDELLQVMNEAEMPVNE